MGRILISLLVLFPAVASAETGPKPISLPDTPSDCARAHAEGKRCELTFDEDELLNGGHISGGTCPPLRPPQLIELRRDFIQEIVASVEDVP